ncbi:hypothetical protein [Streptomyces sp. NPDC126514]|uniref:hypothetical protein n=1 Tax=Streptomyces sp. NPDC126514 TaxID=3155210 RepID=UPI00332A69CF
MRGEDKWEHADRAYRSIDRYWHVLDPILKGWLANGIESLREVTQDDVKRAITTRKGMPARSIRIVLRNVFRALRQEGVIFRDPTRGLVFAGINKTPPSVPSDRLAGVLSHAQDNLQRFVMVLVCVHALSGTDMRHLLLTDLGLSVSASSSGGRANDTSSTWTNSPTAAPPRGSASVTATGQ